MVSYFFYVWNICSCWYHQTSNFLLIYVKNKLERTSFKLVIVTITPKWKQNTNTMLRHEDQTRNPEWERIPYNLPWIQLFFKAVKSKCYDAIKNTLKIWNYILSWAGLQITIIHWTLTDKNLLMPEKSVVWQDVWRIFLFDQDGVLVGHTSFQVKISICSPAATCPEK